MIEWRLESGRAPFDRRVVVTLVGIAGFGLYLWFEAEASQTRSLGLLVAVCTLLGVAGVVGDQLGWLRFMRTDFMSVIIDGDRVTLRAGPLPRTVRFEDVTRIEVRIRGEQLAAVLWTHDDRSVLIPQAAWETLGFVDRLRNLPGVRWDRLDAAFSAGEGERTEIWRGRVPAGRALAWSVHQVPEG